MMQRRMTVARIPPVITTVPAVIRPTPHQTLQRRMGKVRAADLSQLEAWWGGGHLRAGRAPGTGTPGASCRQSRQASLTWGIYSCGRGERWQRTD